MLRERFVEGANGAYGNEREFFDFIREFVGSSVRLLRGPLRTFLQLMVAGF